MGVVRRPDFVSSFSISQRLFLLRKASPWHTVRSGHRGLTSYLIHRLLAKLAKAAGGGQAAKAGEEGQLNTAYVR